MNSTVPRCVAPATSISPECHPCPALREPHPHHRRRHRGRVVRFPARAGTAPDARPRPRDAVQLARAGPDRPAMPRSLRRHRRAVARSAVARRGAGRGGRPQPRALRALRRTAATLGAQGLEAHVADAARTSRGETRRFDVIFLDPPFDDDPWPWLLPACAARLAPGGFVYAEAGRALEPPPPLVPWRSDRAGQVHYHLLHVPAANRQAPPTRRPRPCSRSSTPARSIRSPAATRTSCDARRGCSTG